MAKLTAAQRRNLPKSDFAGPHDSFPINDVSHAEAALRDAPHAYHAGSISKAQEVSIQAKARAFLKGHK